MNVSLARRFGIIASSALMATIACVPAANGATRVSHPAKPIVVSVTATPKTLPSSGGVVSIVVRDKFATTCTVSVLPNITGFPRTFQCAAGHFVAAAHIAANTQPSGLTIRFSVTAHNSHGRSPIRTAIVSQATDIGPMGTALTVHDSSGNALAVTMTQVVDPATGADQYATPNPGDRFVAVEMSLTNQSSVTISDDANIDATVIGTDSQAYTADFNSVAECTNFSSGQFTVLAGSPSESGCVVFQLPNGVNVKAVQFSLDSYVDTAQWNA
jgi:Domain of unknown function (DUF4352)